MSETPEQYKARFEGYTVGKNPVTMQREALHTLAALIKGASEDELRRRPAADKWSVTEILAHLAEDELSSSWRYRQMLEHDGLELPGFDQNLWAKVSQYPAWSAHEALEMFRLIREANLRMFTQLTPEQWQCHGVHAERGRITVEQLCRHMAAHDINHIEQVRKILSGNARKAS